MAETNFQTIEFRGTGMDKDSDQRLMRPGDSRYRLNCVVDSTDDGALGDIQNPKGNTLIPDSIPATGTNVVIGSCKDIANNAVISFLYNSLGQHQIRRIFPDTMTEELILESNLLNFKLNYRITHANVINGLLYWTDGYFGSYLYDSNGLLDFNPPRKINIDKALRYTQSGGTDPLGYATITFETLDRIKYQPPTPPTLEYLYDSTQIENYIYGKLYQFTYRYIYDDKEVSTWSMLSKVLLPIYNFKDNAIFNLLENSVGVTLYSGSEIVVEIEIAIKVNDSFFIVSRLNKDELGIANGIDYQYVYNGIAYKENLLNSSFLRPYDYVPQISSCQEIAGGIMTDANIIEGYDLVDTDIDLAFERYDKLLYARPTSPDTGTSLPPNTNPWGSGGPTSQWPIPTFKAQGNYQFGLVYYDRAGRSNFVSTLDGYTVLVPSYDVDMPNPFAGVLFDPLKLNFSINHRPPEWATHWAPVITKELSYLKKQQFVVTEKYFNFLNNKFRLPSNINYEFTEGDKIRLIGISKSPASTSIDASTGFVNAIGYDDIYAFEDWQSDEFLFPPSVYQNTLLVQSSNQFNFAITEYDPATFEYSLSKEDTLTAMNYFSLLLAESQCDVVLDNRFYIIEIYNKERNTTENKVFYEIGDKFEVGDANLPTRYHKCSLQDQIPDTQPAMGEIRGFDTYLRRKKVTLTDFNLLLKNFVGYNLGSTLSGVTFTKSYIPTFQDIPTPGNLQINMILWDGVTPVFIDTQFNNIIQFEDPKAVGASNIKITQNGGVLVNQATWTVLYAIQFPTNFDIYPWMEDVDFADDYESHTYSDGRVDTNLSTFGRKHYTTRIRWGGGLFQNTETNELSTFIFDNFTELSLTFDEISKIFQVGDTVKVYQKRKMTSYYLQRQVYQDSEGNDQVVQSNQFLSVPNVLPNNFGTYHPGSVARGVRTSYLADAISGKIIRDAGNEPIAISGDANSANDIFRMSKYFRDLLANVRILGDQVNVISCWDDFAQLYTFTVQDLRTEFIDIPDQSQTITFHEPTNRWNSFMSYVPEWYETIGKYVISFKNGHAYLHYTNSVRNRYYGADYGQELHVTSNIGRNTKKVFNNIDVYSNIAWDIPTITIPATANTPNGMLSKLPAVRFKPKEGVFHAAFMRDINDPRYSNSAAIAVINGRRLRGETIELVMTNDSLDLVTLKAINIFVQPSEETI